MIQSNNGEDKLSKKLLKKICSIISLIKSLALLINLKLRGKLKSY